MSNTMKNTDILRNQKLAPYENNPNYNSEEIQNFISVKTTNNAESDSTIGAIDSIK